MTRAVLADFDPALDLRLERLVAVAPERIWQAWTVPEKLMPWFCPRPWTTIACEVDLRPGGRFHTVMRSPEGEHFPNEGCYLELVENERLVWTNALRPGFRPPVRGPGDSPVDFAFTAVITLAREGAGTRYVAQVSHGNAEDCRKHEALGFHAGWGAALDQMVAMIQAG